MGRISNDKAKSSQDSWFGAHTIIHEDVPYMTRYWFWKLRVHVFHRGDKNHDCHDHPWDFWTFPLTSYVEEVLHEQRQAYAAKGHPPPPKFYRTRQVVKRFRLHKRPAEHCHRVLGSFEGYEPHAYPITTKLMQTPMVGNRKIITIVYQAGARRKWGFWKERANRWCWEPWKKYVLEGGRNQGCS